MCTMLLLRLHCSKKNGDLCCFRGFVTQHFIFSFVIRCESDDMLDVEEELLQKQLEELQVQDDMLDIEEELLPEQLEELQVQDDMLNIEEIHVKVVGPLG